MEVNLTRVIIVHKFFIQKKIEVMHLKAMSCTNNVGSQSKF